MFCSKCGRQLRDDDNFCAACGAPVDPDVKPVGPGDKPPEPPGRKSGGAAKKDPGIATPIVALIVAGAVLATLLFVAVIGGDGKSSSSGSSSRSASASASVISTSSSSAESSSSSSSSSSKSASSSSSSSTSKSSSSASSSNSKSSSSSVGAITSQPSPASGLGNVRPIQTANGRLPEDARDIAVAAGKEVFSGKLKMTTFAKRAGEVTPKLQGFEKDDAAIALLEVDEDSVLCEARHAGDPDGKPLSGRIETISIDIATDEMEKFWSQLDGQHVTVASYPTELWWPSDVSGALYSIAGPCELLAYSG